MVIPVFPDIRTLVAGTAHLFRYTVNDSVLTDGNIEC